MALTAQRNGLRGGGATWGAAAGLVLAAGTLWLGLRSDLAAGVRVDLLSVALTGWVLFLVLTPLFGSRRGAIRAEHLALLPLPTRPVVVGLLGAAMVGIAPMVLLLALASLAVVGFQSGLVPGFVGVLAAVLTFTLTIVTMRLLYSVLGTAMQSRLGMEVVALQFGLFFAGLSVGWIVLQPLFEQIEVLHATGLPPLVAGIVRTLPSAWGLVAVDAAGRSEWAMVAAMMLALLASIGGVLVAWSVLVARSMTRTSTRHFGSVRRESLLAAAVHRYARTPTAAVVAKELTTWMRDPWRALEFRIALWTGVLIGTIPLIIGRSDVLPFAGIVVVVMGGVVSSNVYALDGSALWHTLVAPDATRIDVRGRQWAWLLLFAPPAVGLTLVFTALSGQGWAWPLVLAVLPALLGANMGLALLVSALFPSPGVDPRLRSNAMDSSGGASTGVFLMPLLSALVAAPAALVALAGLGSEHLHLRWAGVPVGLVTGAAAAWLAGSFTARHLAATGPEVLDLLRRGTAQRRTIDPADERFAELPLWKRFVVWACGGLFWLPLIPQGVIPLVMGLTGADTHAWMVASWFAPPWSWLVIASMIALGSLMLYATIAIPRSERRSFAEG